MRRACGTRPQSSPFAPIGRPAPHWPMLGATRPPPRVTQSVPPPGDALQNLWHPTQVKPLRSNRPARPSLAHARCSPAAPSWVQNPRPKKGRQQTWGKSVNDALERVGLPVDLVRKLISIANNADEWNEITSKPLPPPHVCHNDQHNNPNHNESNKQSEDCLSGRRVT